MGRHVNKVTDLVVIDGPSNQELAVEDDLQKWANWRNQHPIRASRDVSKVHSGRPEQKGHQCPWTVYAGEQHTHCVVPFRRPVSENQAQPLAGGPVEANLDKHTLACEITTKEHYTNIWRIDVWQKAIR